MRVLERRWRSPHPHTTRTRTIEDGAELVAGGHRITTPELAAGYFVEPTVFVGVTNRMRIARDEIFGPVASLIPFDGEDEAIAIANDTPYGLTAGL